MGSVTSFLIGGSSNEICMLWMKECPLYHTNAQLLGEKDLGIYLDNVIL